MWKLNEDHRIVALCVIDGYAEPGDIGGYIPEGTVLPDVNELLWVAYSAHLGNGVHLASDVVVEGNVRIMHNARLARGVCVGSRTTVGKNTLVGNNTQIKNDCDIGGNCVIAECCRIAGCATVGDNCNLGVSTELSRCVRLGDNVRTSSYTRVAPNAQIASGVELNARNFVQWVGFGLNNRTIVMYIWQEQVVVSVGCQVGIPFDRFAERVANSEGTTADRAAVYQAAMPMFKAAKEYLECSIR